MNKVILTGRITKDLEVRYTTNQNAVCEFNLAVNRMAREGEKNADFINCVVYGQQAENLKKYQGKGSLIAVEGEMRIDSWKTEQNETKYKTYVLTNKIEYLSGTKKDEKTDIDILKEVVNDNPYAEFGSSIEISEDALPF